MTFLKAIESTELAGPSAVGIHENNEDAAGAGVPFRHFDSGDGEMTANSLGILLRRVSGVSTREIDNLIGELQELREKLRTHSNRIQRDIEDYAAVSQHAMQLTKIICESVRKFPNAARTDG